MREFVDNHPVFVYLSVVGVAWIAGYLLLGMEDVSDAVGFIVVPAVLLIGLSAGLWKLWKGRRLDEWESGILGFIGLAGCMALLASFWL
ncbi:MAG: hypothetical protein HYT42_00010 [Candidatus Sungbacteria bacterium]|nr:hypothetical protein [Candidatus Sungbacteria bacterium]